MMRLFRCCFGGRRARTLDDCRSALDRDEHFYVRGPDGIIYRTGKWEYDGGQDEDALFLEPVEVPVGATPKATICNMDFSDYVVLDSYQPEPPEPAIA
jgi:hypothetical protein